MHTTITAKRTALGLLLIALGIAVVLTIEDVQLASSQTVTLVAKRSDVAIPVDQPFDPVWERARTVDVTLSAQNLTPPKAGGDGSVTARALHDGERLYIMAEWDDGTQDVTVNPQTEFTDAVAVQFPVTPGDRVPAFCMGDPNAPVNIWQWKAAWQADVEDGFVDIEDTYPNVAVDLYPFEDEDAFYPARAAGNVFASAGRTTAVDNLLAGTFGTLVQADDQVVSGTGEWRDGSWRVVFTRDLAVDGEYTQFGVGDGTNVAFAIWDGSKDERDGMKSVSQFLTLEVSPELASEGGGGLAIWAVVLIVLGGLGVAAAAGGTYWAQRRKAAS